MSANASYKNKVEIPRIKPKKNQKEPQFIFTDNAGNKRRVNYVLKNDSYFFRACDVWSACTLYEKGFLISHLKSVGDVEKILFDKNSWCPSTRPTYAITLQQALKACNELPGGPHGVETWLRDNFLSPEARNQSPLLVIAAADPIPIAPPETPAAALITSANGEISYVLRCRQDAPRQAWRLPAVKHGETVFWPERLGVDINDINEILGVDVVDSVQNRLWAHRDVQDQTHRLIDSPCWDKMKALPAIRNANPDLVAAYSALFALSVGGNGAQETVNGESEAKQGVSQQKKADAGDQPAIVAWPLASKSLAPPAEAPLSPMQSRSFDFSTATHHVTHVYAAMDDEGRLWVSRPSLNNVFGVVQGWPLAARNAPRRQILCEGESVAAICETNIPLLVGGQEGKNKILGLDFEHWLAAEVSPAFIDSAPPSAIMKIEGKEASFFFQGFSYLIRVAKDEEEDLWVAISDVERLLDHPLKNWQGGARTSPRRLISLNGTTFPAISEEWIESIAAGAPPSRKNRSKAFVQWWTDSVWPMFSAQPSATPSLAPTLAPTLASQAREAARLLVLLADESDALRAENAQLKAENADVKEMKTTLAKKIASVQEALGKIIA